MSKYNKKINIFFFVGIFLLTIRNWFGISQIFNLDSKIFSTILLLSAYLCFVLKILLTKEKINILFKYIFILVIGTIVYIKSKQPSILTIFLTIIAAKNINIKDIINFLFKINFTIMLLHIVLYIIYYIFDLENVEIIRRYVNGKVINRYSFFVGHPNTFSAYYFWILMMYLYNKFDEINIKEYIIMILSMAFIYIFPNSRTTAISIGIVLILILLKNIIVRNGIVNNILRIMPIVLSIVSVIFIFMYNTNIVKKIDDLFSSRITVSRGIYEYYGVSIFGKPITQEKLNLIVGNRILTNISSIDSAYHSVFLNSGILSYILYIYYLQKISNDLTERKKVKERIFFIAMILFAMLETICINPVVAFPLLFISDII